MSRMRILIAGKYASTTKLAVTHVHKITYFQNLADAHNTIIIRHPVYAYVPSYQLYLCCILCILSLYSLHSLSLSSTGIRTDIGWTY